MSIKILGINHLGIAAKDPAKARWFLSDVLGLPFLGEEFVAAQKTNTLMFASAQGETSTVGRLELLQEAGGGEGPIGKFVASRGGGLHHLALSVASVREAIAAMKAHGVTMIDEEPRSGAHHTLIAFVHPKATGGILVEFVEETTP